MFGRFEKVIPWLLASLIVCVAMRGASSEWFVYHMDAARHVLNGTLIYDFVRSGELTHPLAFAKAFYSRFPAISIPYHPPLFAMMEAFAFALLGVNMVAARLVVAVGAGISAVLLYWLVKYTHRSSRLALAATLTFFALPVSYSIARDVMIEFPALAFTLGAIYCLRDLGDGFPPSRAIPFAILASAAVWTKQNAVFLGLVPFAFIVFRGNWRLLKQPTLWASSIFLGLMVLALLQLSLPVKSLGATNQFAESHTVWGAIWYNIIWYRQMWIWENHPFSGIVCLVAIAACLGIPQLRRRPESHLYLAWIMSLLVLVLPLAHHDLRYLLYALPAVFVLICEGVWLVCSRILPARYAAAACAMLTACWIGYHSSFWRVDVPDTLFWRVASNLKECNPKRVAYCGLSAHKLAMAMRLTNPDSRTILIRGDKLDPAVFAAGQFEEFIRRYGIDMVLIEPGKFPIPFDPILHDSPWNPLAVTATPSMMLTKIYPAIVEDTYDVSVFAIKNPTNPAESSVGVNIRNTDVVIDVNLN